MNTASGEIYTLSLHDALPISTVNGTDTILGDNGFVQMRADGAVFLQIATTQRDQRAEEQTSELQSRENVVCGFGQDKMTALVGNHVVMGDNAQIDYNGAGAAI